MYSLLPLLLYGINSIAGAVYANWFLKHKWNAKATAVAWSCTYFVAQVVIFERIESRYPFHEVLGAVINLLLFACMLRMFFRGEASGRFFVCVSFVAGKEIVKYIVSVLHLGVGTIITAWAHAWVAQGKVVTVEQVETVSNLMLFSMSVVSAFLYGGILGIYLLLMHKTYVRKEYPLPARETVFLALPSIAAICISITMKMMIINVENGATILIFDTVPATRIWVPVICVLLLGTILANVILFQSVVQYHEETRKRTMLENQIRQMRKEVREIQEIYTDMRGLRHDIRGHIHNITQYVRRQASAEDEELSGYITKMEETVSRLEFGYQSGNPITDIILHQKKQEADRAGVKLSVDFIYPKELAVDAYDIGIILNNALENGIEAASEVKTDKYVSLRSYGKGSLFFLEVENSFAGKIVMNRESGLPESSKADKKLHGMGLTNIQRCARKYRGDIDIVISDSKQGQQIFHLTIMLNGRDSREIMI